MTRIREKTATPNLTRRLLVLACLLYTLLGPPVATTSPEEVWTCRGPYSNLAYRDCEGQYYNTSGCYFLEHFAQYRACAGICNNVVVNSFKEEKCAAYCPDYLKSCRISSSLTRETTTIKQQQYASSTNPSRSPRSTSLLIPLVVLGFTAVGVAVIIIGVVVCKKKWGKPRSESDTSKGSLLHKLPDMNGGVQVSDEDKTEEDPHDGYSILVTAVSDWK